MSRPSKLCLALLPLMSIAWALSIPAKADTIRFDGGIREDIPSRYRLRFEKWKAEWRGNELHRPSLMRFLGRLRYPAHFGNRRFTVNLIPQPLGPVVSGVSAQ